MAKQTFLFSFINKPVNIHIKYSSQFMSKNQVFINQRQFTQLNEMGISLWCFRDRNSTQITALNTKSTIKNIPLESLKNSLLFNNIISVMGISIGEVTQEHDHFNLGLFNWYFNNTE